MPGLTLDIGMNTREAQKGARDLSESLDEVADSLDDAAREGDQATERLEAGFRDLARAAERESRNAGESLKSNVSRGAETAKESMREVKSEAIQNASETFSSFDGSATSFIDGIQGTFGGLIASLGAISPALIPVGVAGAVAVGLVSSALGKSEEEARDLRVRVSELTEELIETGREGPDAVQRIIDRLKEMVATQEDGTVELRDLYRTTERAGVDSFRRIAQAVAGAGEDADELLETQQKYLDALQEQRKGTVALTEENQELSRRIQAQKELIGELEETKRVTDEAAEAERLWLEAGGPALQAKADVIAAVDQAYDNAAGAADDFINKETGVLDTAAYIAAMQERETALANYQTALAEAKLSPSAKEFLNSQGVEAAAAFLTGYRAATPEQQRELNRIWTEAGQQNSGEYVSELETGISGASVKPPTVAFDPRGDGARYITGLQEYLAKNPVSIPLQGRFEYGRWVP